MTDRVRHGHQPLALVKTETETAAARAQAEVPSMHPALRVALVAEAAGGGVAVHLVDLVRELAARGVEVHLIVPAGDRIDERILTDAAIRCCASVTRVPMHRRVSWRDMLSFAGVFSALWKIQPHIVHAHSAKAGVLARLCFGRWKKVYTPHAVYTLNPWLAPGARRF